MLFSKDQYSERVLSCLCVRSVFDLYFQSRKFPPGTEIIMMGINIPDMIQIVKTHGCVPIPVDYDIDTMCPKSFEDIKAATTDKTRAILFAYLFGVRYDISPIVQFCKERQIDIIEDMAQSFIGQQIFNGTPGATLTMFSFGAIKVQTSVYGGIGVIRDEKLYEEMKLIQDGYQLFTPKMLRKRIMTLLVFYYFINTQRGNKLFDYAARL